MSEIKLSMVDAQCIGVCRRNILDGDAETSQKIAVEMYDIACKLQAENEKLQAKMDKALDQMQHTAIPCEFCKFSKDGTPNDDTCEELSPCFECIENGGDAECWQWNGTEGDNDGK